MMKGQLRAITKQSMLQSAPLGPEGTLSWQQSSTSIRALRSPRNTRVGLGRRKGRGAGMQD